MKRILYLFMIIPLLLCSCKVTKEQGASFTQTPSDREEKEDKFISAVWLSYNEIASLSKGKSEREFRNEIIDLAANLLSNNFNTLIVHAVAFCDSFYESKILPKSERLDKNISYDVFKIITELCSDAGISVQAWINPYRVSAKADLKVLESNPAAKMLYSSDKNSILITDSEIYLNPASRQVQKLILDSVREIIKNYNVTAVHIDDYFYPDMSSFSDRESFSSYRKSGGKLSVEAFRRENVNNLISALHFLLNTYGKKLAISPVADMEKNFLLKYADVSLWLENGWADYIIPQIYFGFENETMPFENVLESWVENTKDKPTCLIIGLAAYKCGEEDENAGSGKNEWVENSFVLSRQVKLILRKNTIYGVAFFSYSHIFDKKSKKITKKELQIIKSML